MRIVPHRLLERDVVGIAEHVHVVGGDAAVARRRFGEVRDPIAAIVEEPCLNTGRDGPLAGWRVRHGGRGRRITVVFRDNATQRCALGRARSLRGTGPERAGRRTAGNGRG